MSDLLAAPGPTSLSVRVFQIPNELPPSSRKKQSRREENKEKTDTSLVAKDVDIWDVHIVFARQGLFQAEM